MREPVLDANRLIVDEFNSEWFTAAGSHFPSKSSNLSEPVPSESLGTGGKTPHWPFTATVRRNTFSATGVSFKNDVRVQPLLKLLQEEAIKPPPTSAALPRGREAERDDPKDD